MEVEILTIKCLFYLVKNKNERKNKKYLCKLLSLSAAVGWLFPESYSEPVQKTIITCL